MFILVVPHGVHVFNTTVQGLHAKISFSHNKSKIDPFKPYQVQYYRISYTTQDGNMTFTDYTHDQSENMTVTLTLSSLTTYTIIIIPMYNEGSTTKNGISSNVVTVTTGN